MSTKKTTTVVTTTTTTIEEINPKIEEMLVNIIIDESSSMSPQRDTVISGINEYVQTLRQKDGEEFIPTKISITKFADTISTPVSGIDIDSYKEITRDDYSPNGMTALYDAIGQTINKIDSKMKDGKTRSVVCVIFTDGEENASKEYRSNVIRDMIKSRQDNDKWMFVFLGANIDSFTVSSTLGINQNQAYNFTMNNTGNAMKTMAMNTKRYRKDVGVRGFVANDTSFLSSVEADSLVQQ